MNDIDFLPSEYRREHSRRRRQVWQIAAIAFVTGTVSLAALVQSRTAANLRSNIDVLAPRYQAAEKRNNRLGELRTKLQDACDQAELFTYLRHPWPRTQIISALLHPLPEGITLRKVRISNRLSREARRPDVRSQAQREAEEKRLASLSPAAHDLEELRGRVDRMRTEVSISGTTAQSAILHTYVGKLARENFFTKAELESCETDKRSKNAQKQFEIDVLVKPGYGQEGGNVQ
jgi:Tfp pilus assembly protein PilN